MAWTVLFAVAIFSLYFFLTQSNPVFTASVLTFQGELVGEESLSTTRSVVYTQSLVGSLNTEQIFTLQASKPLENQPTKYASFKISLENPFPERASLEEVRISKNGLLVDRFAFINTYLEKGESYEYETRAVELEGLDSQKNTIVVEAFFEGADGLIASSKFEYVYLSVTRCESNDDCPALSPVCDINNGAKLSKDMDVNYCVRVCNNHNDCATGQICLPGGYCGY